MYTLILRLGQAKFWLNLIDRTTPQVTSQGHPPNPGTISRSVFVDLAPRQDPAQGDRWTPGVPCPDNAHRRDLAMGCRDPLPSRPRVRRQGKLEAHALLARRLSKGPSGTTCGIGYPPDHSHGSSHQADRHMAFPLPRQRPRVVVFFLGSLLQGRQAMGRWPRSFGHPATGLENVTGCSASICRTHCTVVPFMRRCRGAGSRSTIRIVSATVDVAPRDGLPRVALRHGILPHP